MLTGRRSPTQRSPRGRMKECRLWGAAQLERATGTGNLWHSPRVWKSTICKPGACSPIRRSFGNSSPMRRCCCRFVAPPNYGMRSDASGCAGTMPMPEPPHPVDRPGRSLCRSKMVPPPRIARRPLRARSGFPPTPAKRCLPTRSSVPRAECSRLRQAP